MARFFSKMTTKEPSVFVCVCVCVVCVQSVTVFNYLRLRCHQNVIAVWMPSFFFLCLAVMFQNINIEG